MFRRLMQWLNRGSASPTQVFNETHPIQAITRKEPQQEVQQHHKSALQAVKPHVPLIKFPSKKEVPKFDPSALTSAGDSAVSSAPSSSKPIGKTPRGSGIDYSELPLKYQRRPIPADEMEFIEKGGPV